MMAIGEDKDAEAEAEAAAVAAAGGAAARLKKLGALSAPSGLSTNLASSGTASAGDKPMSFLGAVRDYEKRK